MTPAAPAPPTDAPRDKIRRGVRVAAIVALGACVVFGYRYHSARYCSGCWALSDVSEFGLATSIGLSEDAIARLMNDVGFARKGGAWRWRGRRASRSQPREPASHAFAELEKLRRK